MGRPPRAAEKIMASQLQPPSSTVELLLGAAVFPLHPLARRSEVPAALAFSPPWAKPSDVAARYESWVRRLLGSGVSCAGCSGGGLPLGAAVFPPHPLARRSDVPAVPAFSPPRPKPSNVAARYESWVGRLLGSGVSCTGCSWAGGGCCRTDVAPHAPRRLRVPTCALEVLWSNNEGSRVRCRYSNVSSPVGSDTQVAPLTGRLQLADCNAAGAPRRQLLCPAPTGVIEGVMANGECAKGENRSR